LVLIGDHDKASDAARRWTYFLDRGDASDLAELALCDLVCSVREDLALQFSEEFGEFPADTMALLIGADNQEFALIASSGVVPTNRFVESEAEPKELVSHNTAVARALLSRIAPDRPTLERRAAAVRQCLVADDLLQLHGAVGKSTKSLATIARLAPAELALRALDEPTLAASCVSALANEASLRWRVGRPPGARWGNRGFGCSADRLEGSPHAGSDARGAPCGTGFAPDYSKRFLWFYAEHQRLEFEDAPKR
jgi:hypothetical protein